MIIFTLFFKPVSYSSAERVESAELTTAEVTVSEIDALLGNLK